MDSFVIEFNDAAITVSRGQELLLQSPGYAVMDGDHLYIGAEAQDIARIRPRWTNNHFWAQLSVEPMAGATPRVRHHADLAFAHLKRLWEQVGERGADVVFAVPGSWSANQLGLLLGFANELGLEVRSMVDSALAAAAGAGVSGDIRHLDISLHRILLSEIHAADELVRERVLVVAEEGLVHFNNLWTNVIADQFVHATRFDPLHRAETEQALHDGLPACLAEVEEKGATTVEVSDREQLYSVTVRRDQLVAAAAQAYPRIIQQLRASGDREETLLLSERFAGFPGLLDALSVLPGAEVRSLPPGAAGIGCALWLDSLSSDDEQVHFFTELRGRGGEPVTAGAEDDQALPTHLLYRGQAWAVTGRPMVLAISGGAVVNGADAGQPQCSVISLDGRVWLEPRPDTEVSLNGREVDDRVTLSVGDSLAFDGLEDEVQAISLVS